MRNILNQEWYTSGQAACRGMDTNDFYPPSNSGLSLREIKRAKQVCEECPVLPGCLQWALDTGEKGVWGGTTETERRAIRLRRKAAAGAGPVVIKEALGNTLDTSDMDSEPVPELV